MPALKIVFKIAFSEFMQHSHIFTKLNDQIKLLKNINFVIFCRLIKLYWFKYLHIDYWTYKSVL